LNLEQPLNERLWQKSNFTVKHILLAMTGTVKLTAKAIFKIRK